MSPATTTQALVRGMRHEALDVLSIELARTDGASWPDAGPGAHVDVEIPGVGPRQYSLLPGSDATQLHIGVQRDARSRGGSRWVHEHLRPGQTLRVGTPRNHFELDAGQGPAVLIAGGIGITPLLAMAHALAATGRDWRLHHAVRHRERAAFAPWLQRLGERARLHVDDEADGPIALEPLVRAAAPGTHFYGCGPQPMLEAFARATAACDPRCVHVEHFAAPAAPAQSQPAAGFEVELARSGRRIAVPPHMSILDVLLDHGIDVPCSCLSGVCGSCETRVLAGEPEHHDAVLSPEERASGQTMMLCVSRAAGAHLLLDL